MVSFDAHDMLGDHLGLCGAIVEGVQPQCVEEVVNIFLDGLRIEDLLLQTELQNLLLKLF